MYQKILLSIFAILAMVYISVNIYFTQRLPSFFFDLVYNNNPKAAILFLKRSVRKAYFSDQLHYLKNIYGTQIEQAIAASGTEKQNEVAYYEKLISQNKKARDVLIKLAILYFKNDQLNNARNYYLKAKLVDPTIQISELEKIL